MKIFALPSLSSYYSILFVSIYLNLNECQSQFLNPQQIPLGSQAMMKSGLKTRNYENRVNGGTAIEGSPVFTSHLLLQRSTAIGTDYHHLRDPYGPPLYRRKVVDANKQFVTFPDPLWPDGSGRYIVLKRAFVHLPTSNQGGVGVGIGGIAMQKQHQILREPVYQGFFLVLSDSMHAYISKWSPPLPMDPLKSAGISTDPKFLHHPTFDVEHESWMK